MELLEEIDLFQRSIMGTNPFEGSVLERLKDYYRIELTWSSNALAGNILSKMETKMIIEDEISIGGKLLQDIYEAVNHAKAYDYMVTLLNNKQITETDILTLHSIFYRDINPEYAGVYRDASLDLTVYSYPVTETGRIEEEMKNLCNWMKEERKNLHPVEVAAQVHKKFMLIYPFQDGNGRVARLLMNAVLMQEGYLPVIIAPAFQSDYISLLESAHNEENGFVEFIAERELESQKEMLQLLQIPFPKLEEGMMMQ